MKKDLRIRPKSDYFDTATLEELFVLSEHWKSDLEFYKDELTFLSHLIGKYFIMMVKEERIQVVQEKVVNLNQLNVRLDSIMNQIDKNMSEISKFLQNGKEMDETVFRQDHQVLEEEFTNLVKDLHAAKQNLFKITEHVLEADKLQHLLTQ